MFIYLNRTGYNGLFRVNAQRRLQRSRRPLRAPNDRESRQARAGRGSAVATRRAAGLGSFERALEIAAAGDFLYSDPPYAPLSATASFTAYTAARFDEADQARLQQVVLTMARTRLPRAAQQLDGARHLGAVRNQPEATRRGAARIPRAGAAGDQQQRVAPRARVEYLITEHAPRGVTAHAQFTSASSSLSFRTSTASPMRSRPSRWRDPSDTKSKSSKSRALRKFRTSRKTGWPERSMS